MDIQHHIFNQFITYWYYWIPLIIIYFLAQNHKKRRRSKRKPNSITMPSGNQTATRYNIKNKEDSVINRLKGWYGELKVRLTQWWHLDKKNYHTFYNVTLPCFSGGTTQIDHIIVSLFGIFVIETKNWNGWIHGEKNDERWTRTFIRTKSTFLNPLKQNDYHIKTISEIFKNPKIQENKFHSIIVFTGNHKFTKNMPENVISLKNYISYIKSKQKEILTHKDIVTISEGINTYRLHKNPS